MMDEEMRYDSDDSEDKREKVQDADIAENEFHLSEKPRVSVFARLGTCTADSKSGLKNQPCRPFLIRLREKCF